MTVTSYKNSHLGKNSLVAMAKSRPLLTMFTPDIIVHADNFTSEHFYRAMHFSAKRGLAIVCRSSVRL